MEQSFNLNPKEIQSMTTMEQENLRLNARYGMLRREQDDLDKRIGASENEQRAFIRRALQERGCEQFLSARIDQGQILCTLPDQPAMEVIPPAATLKEKPNAKPKEEAVR